ncbi:glycosyltransferase family 71 protein [Pyrenophora tritici-repentis]|nr:glycosyltransferase family 71 protein [Pyrenophora tritici-repentis]
MLVHFNSSIPRLLVLPLFLLICGIFLFPRQYHGSAALYFPIVSGKNLTEASSTFDTSVRQFWNELATALVESQPQCDPLKINDEEEDKAMIKFVPLEPHKEHPKKLIGAASGFWSTFRQGHKWNRYHGERKIHAHLFGVVTDATKNRMYAPRRSLH